ncbi:MAG: ankyrin repeat domain-containing protein [Acidimicrobiia bacterium]|nr:ankyrin repeat domain-containing protein [Acidimicrobiia bacterium]
MQAAAPRGHVAVVERLVEAGATVNDRDAGGTSPLMAAVESGSRRTVERLLAAGADPDALADGELTATLDRKHGHPDIAMLIASSAPDLPAET